MFHGELYKSDNPSSYTQFLCVVSKLSFTDKINKFMIIFIVKLCSYAMTIIYNSKL